MKNKLKKLFSKKRNIILIVVATFIILLIGIVLFINIFNKNKSELAPYIENTILSSSKVKSYKAHITIKSKDVNESYLVFDNGTKKSKIVHATVEKNYKDNIYKNTDVFLNSLNYVKITENNVEIPTSKVYSAKKFTITKDELNKMMKDFNIKVNQDGNGIVYFKNDEVYLIVYNSGDLYVSATYTNIVRNK